MTSARVLLTSSSVASNLHFSLHWVFKFCLLYFSFIGILFGPF